MPIIARRHIKKMRGGAQAHLIEGDDGSFYVVKFLNNPQHRRILVNELVCSVFLRYLQISCADIALIEVTAEFLSENPHVSLELGTQSIAVAAGRHFGSKFPGDPSKLAVYDFLPDLIPAIQEATSVPIAFDNPSVEFHKRCLKLYDPKKSGRAILRNRRRSGRKRLTPV